MNKSRRFFLASAAAAASAPLVARHAETKAADCSSDLTSPNPPAHQHEFRPDTLANHSHCPPQVVNFLRIVDGNGPPEYVPIW